MQSWGCTSDVRLNNFEIPKFKRSPTPAYICTVSCREYLMAPGEAGVFGSLLTKGRNLGEKDQIC